MAFSDHYETGESSSASSDAYVRVLLVEQEPETISVVSFCLSEIKECQLQISFSSEEALLKMPEYRPDLVLVAHGLLGKDGLEVVNEIHHKYPSVYLIVSLPTHDQNLIDSFMIAGVHDCLLKDRNYVSNLVNSVKKALIRISERDAFDLPNLNRAERFAMDENLPDIVFSLDLSGKFLHVNRAITPLLGYEQNQIVNSTLTDLISGEEARKRLAEYLNSVESLINFRDVLPLINSIGIEENFEINCTLMEGELIYGVLRKEGITDHLDQVSRPEQRLEESAEPTRETLQEGESLPAFLGPYRIVTLLGAGAMGRVYKGFDDHLERNVAIKVIKRAHAEEQQDIERFRREAKILASISHPNIALIFYYGQLEDLPFFCMEYLPGGSLESLIRQKGVLDPVTAVSYTLQVAIGLKEAYEKGIVHLDIKPSNLMLAENNRIKIVDFGLARTKVDLEVERENILGTPLYVAPEQITGEALDHRCDVYSLGITLFEMLYGHVPFSGGSIHQIFASKIHDDLPSRDTLNPAVPGSLYELIQKMTTRDLTQRISDYSLLIDELENARRSLLQLAEEEIPVPAETEIRMKGSLHDISFAEILGRIWRERMSGKLTLSWIDVYKTLHFRDGKLISALSSQEGETFVDLVVSKYAMTGTNARKIKGKSAELFDTYSSIMDSFGSGERKKLLKHIEEMAWQILERLFTWRMGEFILEEGNFPQQMNLEIDLAQIVTKGVKSWMDDSTLRRKLFEGACTVELNPEFMEVLKRISLDASDRFLLFRFERSIPFHQLHQLSAISEEQFSRLIYVFSSLGLVSITPTVEQKSPPRSAVKRKDETSLPTKGRASELLVSFQPSTAQMDPSAYYLQCAASSYASRNYWATVEFCKKALATRQDSRIYRLMGNALSTHPAFRHDALDAYKKALELDPDNPAIERDIADLYFDTGNYALARAKYETALKLDPLDIHSQERLKEIKRIKK